MRSKIRYHLLSFYFAATTTLNCQQIHCTFTLKKTYNRNKSCRKAPSWPTRAFQSGRNQQATYGINARETTPIDITNTRHGIQIMKTNSWIRTDSNEFI